MAKSHAPFFVCGMGPRVPSLNGTDGSKLIVRPMAATLIRDGVAMGLQFIKNVRLIVQGWDPLAPSAAEIIAVLALVNFCFVLRKKVL